MASRLLILGSGSFAVEALEIAELMGTFEVLGFVNSLDRILPGTLHSGLPVFSMDTLPAGPSDCLVVAGIVSNKRRAFVEQVSARGYRAATLVHSSATVSPRATIAEGCIVGAAAVVASSTRVQRHVILNRGCLIGHDNDVGAFSTIGPGANIAGAVTIGEDAYIGVGAVVRDHLSVGAGAVIGAGSVVVKSVDGGTMVAGVPAKTVRTGVYGL